MIGAKIGAQKIFDQRSKNFRKFLSCFDFATESRNKKLRLHANFESNLSSISEKIIIKTQTFQFENGPHISRC